MRNFPEVFLIIFSLYPNLKLMSALYIHETFLVYKLETFKNCKEVKHIMIMIIAIIYIFLSYVIFDQQLKITFRKSSAPPWKNPLPPLYSLLTPSQKISKSASPRLFANVEKFSGHSAERAGEDTVNEGGIWWSLQNFLRPCQFSLNEWGINIYEGKSQIIIKRVLVITNNTLQK